MTRTDAGSVLVAMSGGVDSTVAALLLLREGWRVEGVTLDLLGEGGHDSPAARAARGCARLGIPHHVVDGRDAFRRRVVDPFLAAYGVGRTPNPCVRCNEEVKFALLLEEMERRRFDRIATGHYATVRRTGSGTPAVAASPHRGKDQSYFLYRLSRPVLERLLLPVGTLRKEEVRGHAAEAGLEASGAPDSQDVCFLGGRHVAAWLEEEGVRPPPGEIVDGRGRTLGRHGGIHRFTVGQRRGLGVSAPEPLYVRSLEAASNRVVVGTRKENLAGGALLSGAVLNGDAAGPFPVRATARIRHRHPGVDSTAAPEGDFLRVRFDSPQGGVAPGQSLVLYRDGTVLGGGIIQCPCA